MLASEAKAQNVSACQALNFSGGSVVEDGIVSSDGPVSHVYPPSRSRDARPPGAGFCSRTTTSWPCACRRSAAARPPLRALRNIGMLGFDLVPGVRSLFAKHTMGLAGRLPRLSRGVPVK